MSGKLDQIERGSHRAPQRERSDDLRGHSRALDVSDATVYNRVKRLIEMGVIRRFTIEVDEEAVGRMVSGFILVNVEPGAVKEVSKQLTEIETVSEV